MSSYDFTYDRDLTASGVLRALSVCDSKKAPRHTELVLTLNQIQKINRETSLSGHRINPKEAIILFGIPVRLTCGFNMTVLGQMLCTDEPGHEGSHTGLTHEFTINAPADWNPRRDGPSKSLWVVEWKYSLDPPEAWQPTGSRCDSKELADKRALHLTNLVTDIAIAEPLTESFMLYRVSEYRRVNE